MYFLLGLISVYAALWLLSLAGVDALAPAHIQGTYAAAIMFIVAGILHFVRPRQFIKMMPQGIWSKEFTNWFIGVTEIGLGLALFVPEYTLQAAIALIGLLILVFPANLIQANNDPKAYNIIRLLLQPIFIGWIYWFCIYHTW